MKDKKKYTKKYYTGGRVDMSKGGRVGLQKGGPTNLKKPIDIEDRPMSIEREEETKKTQPKVTPKQAKPVTEQKPVQPQAQQQGFTKAPTTFEEQPISIGGVGGSSNVDLDEQFGAVGGTTEPVTP